MSQQKKQLQKFDFNKNATEKIHFYAAFTNEASIFIGYCKKMLKELGPFDFKFYMGISSDEHRQLFSEKEIIDTRYASYAQQTKWFQYLIAAGHSKLKRFLVVLAANHSMPFRNLVQGYFTFLLLNPFDRYPFCSPFDTVLFHVDSTNWNLENRHFSENQRQFLHRIKRIGVGNQLDRDQTVVYLPNTRATRFAYMLKEPEFHTQQYAPRTENEYECLVKLIQTYDRVAFQNLTSLLPNLSEIVEDYLFYGMLVEIKYNENRIEPARVEKCHQKWMLIGRVPSNQANECEYELKKSTISAWGKQLNGDLSIHLQRRAENFYWYCLAYRIKYEMTLTSWASNYVSLYLQQLKRTLQ